MAAQNMQVGIGSDGVALVQQLTTFDSSAQLVREPFTFELSADEVLAHLRN